MSHNIARSTRQAGFYEVFQLNQPQTGCGHGRHAGPAASRGDGSVGRAWLAARRKVAEKDALIQAQSDSGQPVRAFLDSCVNGEAAFEARLTQCVKIAHVVARVVEKVVAQVMEPVVAQVAAQVVHKSWRK
jgi:hypothetical protein